MWRIVLISLVSLANCQFQLPSNGNVDPTQVAEGVEGFKRMYGIATQIMELSGNLMGSQGGSGSDGGGGRALGRGDVRPNFQGVRSFETDNSVTSGGGSDNAILNMAKLFSQYGSGLIAPTPPTTTTTTTTTTRPNPIQSLLSTFLGSSVDNTQESLPPPPTPKPRQSNILGIFGQPFGAGAGVPPPQPAAPKQENGFMGLLGGFLPTTPAPTTRQPSLFGMFGVPTATQTDNRQSSSSLGKINLWELMGMAPKTTTTTQAPLRALLNPANYGNGDAQNIDTVINALMRSNARPAAQAEPGPASFLSQFLGGK